MNNVGYLLMRTKLIVFFIVVGLAIVGAFGWVGYQLFMTGFSARAEPHAWRS